MDTTANSGNLNESRISTQIIQLSKGALFPLEQKDFGPLLFQDKIGEESDYSSYDSTSEEDEKLDVMVNKVNTDM